MEDEYMTVNGIQYVKRFKKWYRGFVQVSKEQTAELETEYLKQFKST